MRFRLYPTAAQEAELLRHCAEARYVWNLALEQRNLYRPGRPTPNYVQQSKQLTEARKGTWLGDGVRVVQEQALRDLDRAFRDWWRGTHRRPTWRVKGRHEGFCVSGGDLAFRAGRWNRRWGYVTVPSVGEVRFRWTRTPPDTRTYRVRRDASGRWWVSFQAKPAPITAPGDGSIVGLDRGVAVSVMTSESAAHTAPPGRDPRRIRRERALARGTRGSARRDRARRRLACVRADEANRRRDWVEKLSTELARNYDLIRVEDLRIGQMTRRGRGKRGLNRSILEAGWGELVRRLEDKAPGRVEKVDPRYTSQCCSVCGHTSRENRESQAVFLCVSCGHTDNADVNAARNIAARQAVTARGGLGLPELAKREPHGVSPVESAA